MRTARCVRLISLLFVTVSTFAQTQTAPASKPHIDVATIAADPKDVSSIDGIVRAYYDVINGPAGQPRQWSRDRTLYWPGIRFFSIGDDQLGKERVSVMSHQEYVDRSNDHMVRRGFFEQEIHRVLHRYGNIAQVFSTYESREKANGPVTARGINSLDLIYDGARWWIISASWQDETKERPIPPEYLPRSAPSNK